VIAIAPSAPEDVAVVDDGSSDLLDLDDLSLDVETQPGANENENTATASEAAVAEGEEAMEIVGDLDVLAESVAVEEADLEGIEIEAGGDTSQSPELMSGAESLFDHGADLSRYHHDDE
jgi:hypothetical protein